MKRLSTAVAARSFSPALLLATVPPDPAGGTESWVQLMKEGDFWDPRYGHFTVDAAMLQTIVSNFDGIAHPVPGDYDHSFGVTGTSLACGWVKQLQIRGDELWGLVAWTQTAVDQIRSGEYRYISPEYSEEYIDETGQLRGPALVAFGLTNRPFLEGMAEVALAASPSGSLLHRRVTETGRPSVDPKILAEALGLSADTSEADLVAALKKRLTGDPDTVTVPKKDYDALAAAAAKSDEEAKKAHELAKAAVVDKGIGEGKIPPAHRSIWLSAYDIDPDGTMKQIGDLEPLALFKPVGGKGKSILPPEVAADAPASDRIHALAVAAQKEDPKLSYRDAVSAAYREVNGKVEA